MKTVKLSALLTALTAFSLPAYAGPATDLAKGRIEAIASGDVAQLMSGYGEGAVLHWIGGPLDGDYSASASKDVWSKYEKAQGVQKASIAAISEAGNPKGMTVTADVAFAGRNTVKIRYVLLYRDGKIKGEIWQVNPGAQ